MEFRKKAMCFCIFAIILFSTISGATVSFDPSKTGSVINPRNLAGTCLPIWNDTSLYNAIKKGLSTSNYRLFRFPNGAMSDGYHWNGSGFYNADSVWVCDSSTFKPGFAVTTLDRGTSENWNTCHSNITDGDTSTFWRSDELVSGSAPYFYLQFSASTVVDSIVIFWGEKYAVDFNIDFISSAVPSPGPCEYSSNLWKTQKQITGNDKTVFSSGLPSTGVWYVRVIVNKFMGREKSVEVKEVYLYAQGKQVSVNVKQYSGSSSGDQTSVIASPTHEGSVVRADFAGWVTWDFEKFMAYIHSISDSSVPVICVNYGTGTPQEAAAWVYYANIVKKYNIRFWQIGNEMENPWEEGGPVNALMYAEKYLEFAKAMKQVDSTIKILGPVLWTNADFYLQNSGVYNGKSWAQTFLDTIGALEKADGKKYCDGFDFHSYPYFDTTDPTAAGMMQMVDYMYDQSDSITSWIARSLLNPDSVYVMMSEYNSLVVPSDLLQKPLNGVFVANMFAGLAQKFGGRAMSVFWDSFEDVSVGPDGTFGSWSLFNVLTNSYFSSFVKAPSAAYWALYAAQNLWINPGKRDTLVAAAFKRSDNVRAYGIKTDTDFRALMFNVSFSPETLSCSLAVNTYDRADVYTWGEAEFKWNGSNYTAVAFPNCGPVSYSTPVSALRGIVIPAQSLCVVRFHNADGTDAAPTIVHFEAQDANANPKRALVVCGSVSGGTNIIHGIDYAFDADTTLKTVKSLDDAYDGPFESFFDSISTAGLKIGLHVLHIRARTGPSAFAFDSVAFYINTILGAKRISGGNSVKISEKRLLDRIELTFSNSVLSAGRIKAQIFTLDGKCVRNLACVEKNGQSIVQWSGEDAADNKVGHGIYLLVVKSAGNVVYKKPIVISR
jgi:hypothetical protein